MIGRKPPAPSVVNAWEDEGRRLAPLLGSASAAVVVGNDAEDAARVAIGIAREAALERRVAIGDLTGASPSLVALAGDGSALGITDSFRHGVSLNDIARPAADGTASLFILPCGSASTVPEDVVASERWSRLAAGFADAGALLLLVATAESPGLEALVAQTDGAVSVGDAPLPLEWRVLAQAGDRAPPAAHVLPARPPRRWWSAGRLVSVVLLVVALLAAAGAWLWRRTDGSRARPGTGAATTPQRAVPPAAPAPADTVSVGTPVNPPDSANASEFAVELVATNTVAGANLWVRERGAPLPGVTVSPVLLGGGQDRWHKVMAGAWRDRAGADSMLAALREDGVLRAGAGLVVRVPLALMLEKDVPRSAAPARVAALVARGVPAYALVQDDGTVRLFAGAFETAAAAVTLGAELRAAGLAPQLAYRTGRTF